MAGWWWLEPWNFEWLSHHIGNFIIPTDEVIFFQRVWLKPPTSSQKSQKSIEPWLMSRQTQGSSTRWSLEFIWEPGCGWLHCHPFSRIVEIQHRISHHRSKRSEDENSESPAFYTQKHGFCPGHIQTWLVVWNMFFPYIGNNYPNWWTHFSEGLKPPTRNFLLRRTPFFWRARRPGLWPQSVDTFPSFSVPTLQFSGRQSPHK